MNSISYALIMNASNEWYAPLLKSAIGNDYIYSNSDNFTERFNSFKIMRQLNRNAK